MDEVKLKPCPFCGGTIRVWPRKGYGVVTVLECEACKIRFVISFAASNTGPDLCRTWNRREGEDIVCNKLQ